MSVLGADEAVVPESDVNVLMGRIRELERLRARKTPENEILKDAIAIARKKTVVALALAEAGLFDESHRRSAGVYRGRT